MTRNRVRGFLRHTHCQMRIPRGYISVSNLLHGQTMVEKFFIDTNKLNRFSAYCQAD